MLKSVSITAKKATDQPFRKSIFTSTGILRNKATTHKITILNSATR